MNPRAIDWLVEFVSRMFTKSPKFFRVWQGIGSILMAISAIPELLNQIDQQFETKIWDSLPPIITMFANKTILISGIIMWVMSKQPMKQSVLESTEKEQREIEKATPFTTKQIQKEESQLPK